MTVTVKLDDVVEAMELPQEWQSYLDPETEEIVTVTDEQQMYLEEDVGDLSLARLPDWMRESVEKARRVLVLRCTPKSGVRVFRLQG